MSTSTITSKGQTTIPADIRAFLHVGAGDKLMYVRQPNGKVLLATKKRDVRELFGCLPKPKRYFTIEEIKEGIGDAIAEKYRKVNRIKKIKKAHKK